MKRFTLLIILLVSLSLVAAQCVAATSEQAAPAEEEPAAAQEAEMAEEEPAPSEEEAAPAEEEEMAAGGEERTIVIGYTSSNTGSLEVPSRGQTRGLELWLERVNERGLELSDGTVVTFETINYDDESAKERVQLLYTTLIEEDQADFLISPYSSGLTDAAAVIAEQYGKVMITTGAASDATYKKGLTNAFQLYTPASRYLTGAIDLLGNVDPEAKEIAMVYENAKFSTDVVEAAEAYAEENGYEVVLFEGYDSETTDFAPFINKIEASAPKAIMGGGHFNDGSTFARQLEEKQTGVNFLALLVAPPELEFAELGEAALGVVGPSQWEPQANYSEAAAEEAGVDWYGPTVAEFAEVYEAVYGEEPGYHAAGGYAAALILENAILEADSVDQEQVKTALENMDLMTFYGHVKFDTSEEAHGLQSAHDMVYVQWQRDDEGNLVKEVVWPLEAQSSEPLYPLP